MPRTAIKFKNTNKNLFEVCDKWAKTHKFKTIESTKSNSCTADGKGYILRC